MNGIAFRQALGRRQTLFGTLVVSPSPAWVSAVAGLGLDYVFIDTEHVPLDRQTLAWMCRAYEAAGIAPLVRIPSPDPFEASMALDGGAAAILAPYVETVAQVQALVGAVKHKPVKGARLGDMLATPDAYPAQRAYAETTNAGRSLLINVESVPAMEQLDALLAVPGPTASSSARTTSRSAWACPNNGTTRASRPPSRPSSTRPANTASAPACT